MASPIFKKILVVPTERVAAWTPKDDRLDPGIGNKTAQAVASYDFFALYTGAVNNPELGHGVPCALAGPFQDLCPQTPIWACGEPSGTVGTHWRP